MATRLSAEGSDRATAYNISNKIVRRGDHLFVGWLDVPAEKEGPVRIRLAVGDGVSSERLDTFALGEGVDSSGDPFRVIENMEWQRAHWPQRTEHPGRC